MALRQKLKFASHTRITKKSNPLHWEGQVKRRATVARGHAAGHQPAEPAVAEPAVAEAAVDGHQPAELAVAHR